jgi:hypothetical protein
MNLLLGKISLNIKHGMDIQALIKELSDILISKYPECKEKIGQGSSLAQIELAITKIRPIPKALIDIYSCVGGENSDLEYCVDLLALSYYLVPLEQIDSLIDFREELRLQEWVNYFNELSEVEFNKVATWKPDMIPFLEDGSGCSIVLRTLPDDESIWKIPKVEDSYKINTNLNRLLLTEIECYRQGAYQDPEDEDEVMEVDWDLAEEIARKIDPEIEDQSYS